MFHQIPSSSKENPLDLGLFEMIVFLAGCPTLSGSELQRVELDNEASDFALALQQMGQ